MEQDEWKNNFTSAELDCEKYGFWMNRNKEKKLMMFLDSEMSSMDFWAIFQDTAFQAECRKISRTLVSVS